MAEIKVLLSAAFKEAYVRPVPQFERASGHKVETLWAPSGQIMKRMKEGEVIKSKVTRVQGEPAGAVVARGEAEIGFQQVCELLPVPGIDLSSGRCRRTSRRSRRSPQACTPKRRSPTPRARCRVLHRIRRGARDQV